jgi:hypothetical protein
VPRKTKSRASTRRSADDRRPPLKRAPHPPGTNAQSPLSQGVEQDAQRLIHQAGSPSLAKRAVDQAAEREAIPDFRQDQFALRWGFPSRREMLAASRPAGAARGQFWWTTAVGQGRWIAWSDDDLSAEITFRSEGAAKEWVDRLTSPEEAEPDSS